MKALIWGRQNWYHMTNVTFDPPNPPLNGLMSQKTHTACIPSRHISKQCVFGSVVTPFYRTSISHESFTCWSQKCTNTSSSKNTLFNQLMRAHSAINYTLFNLIFILKHPGMILTNTYREIFNLRTHLISSKSVPPTLKSSEYPAIWGKIIHHPNI